MLTIMKRYYSILFILYYLCLFLILLISLEPAIAEESDRAVLFDVRKHFPHGTVKNDPELFDAMQEYINIHHRDVVMNDDNFCNRTFVIATYACPQLVGNHMHEFLNAYVGAFLTNRTLVWMFCERKPCKWDVVEDCDEFLTRHPWIMSAHEYRQVAQQKNCPWVAKDFGLIHLIGQHLRNYVEEFVMCCGLDELSKFPMINFGTHELHNFFSLSLPNARLLPHGKSLAHLLFRRGEDYGYGFLLRSAFQFKSYVTERNHEMILQALSHSHVATTSQALSTADQSSLEIAGSDEKVASIGHHHSHQRPFFFSIHLRHAEYSSTGDAQDITALRCLEQIIPDFYPVLHLLNETTVGTSSDESGQHHHVHKTHGHRGHHSGKRPCVILFASDRPHSLQFWNTSKIINNLVDCTVVTTNHSKTLYSMTEEHGPFTGQTAMFDLELLSHGNVFLGSSYMMKEILNFVSTFSLLAAELRATNGKEYSMDYKSRWLPDCREILASSKVPKDMFLNHQMNCTEVISQSWYLHDACPYHTP